MKQFFYYVGGVIVWLAILALGLYVSRAFENYAATRNEITIGTWGDIFDAELIAQFEKETGIAVRMSYYSSNEELVAKMKATGGDGLDLVVPSDYAVKQLIDLGFLQKIDKTKLKFYSNLYPELLGHSFDSANEYSVPWQWEVYGFGINTKFFTPEQVENASWDLIFKDPQCRYTITMVNDPIEMMLLAGHYVYGKQQTFSAEQLVAIQNLLLAQKKWVKAYVDFRADYFLTTKNCPVVVSSSSYIIKSQRRFPEIKFIIPRTGTFVTIENCVLPRTSRKQDAVYALLNFLYRPEHGVLHHERYGLFPAMVQNSASWQTSDYALFERARSLFSEYSFFKRSVSALDLVNMWALIKSHEC